MTWIKTDATDHRWHCGRAACSFVHGSARMIEIAGTSPAMTTADCGFAPHHNRFRRAGQPWDKPGQDGGVAHGAQLNGST
jgi:hypothetical protein